MSNIPLKYQLDEIIPIGSLDGFSIIDNNKDNDDKIKISENNFRSIRVRIRHKIMLKII